jgi:Coenzyme PQQ synthesis protein D (PqqD)
MARVKPRACADLAVAEIDGEAVVWDRVPEKLHYLNHSAALVFGLCDGQTTIAQMAEAIGDAYEMDPRELDAQIRPLLRQLNEAGLVEGKAAEQIAREAGQRKAALKSLRRIPVPQDT